MGIGSRASSRGSRRASLTGTEKMDDDGQEELAAQSTRMSMRPSMMSSTKKSVISSKTNSPNIGPAEHDLTLLSTRAGNTFRNSKFDLFLARWKLIPIWVLFLMAVGSSFSVVPVIIVEWVPNFSSHGKWIWRALVISGFLNSLPFWIVLTQWRPAEPLNGKPLGPLPHVDILIPCYKEPTSTVVDTIVTCQRIEYSSNNMHCYVLDDGASNNLRRSVEALKKSGLLRFPLTYVRRPTNEGKKGGNLNFWLRTYEEVSGEFFIVLDADMQPFPDMMDTLMGHYYGLPAETRERLSFLQAPQWYRNNYADKKWKDVFNVSEILFYKVLQPAMSHHGCALYVGCLALWNRRAIESIGGFIEGYATEDSVTGCQLNRTRIPGRQHNWISKYVCLPVAAGETPDSLPSLFDQRMRWFYGLCQMFKHHNGYVFASGLTFFQKIMFWVTSASFVTNIVNYTLGFSGAMILLISIAYYGFTSTLEQITIWSFWVGGLAWVLNFFIFWAFCPGITVQQAVLTITSSFLYTPVLIASVLSFFFGFKLHVQDTVDRNEDSGKGRRWHRLFIFPLVSILFVTAAAITAVIGLIVCRDPLPWELVAQIPLWWGLWIFLHQHTIAAMLGFRYKYDEFYEEEFQGTFSSSTIQQKMQKHAVAIDDYQHSLRGSARSGLQTRNTSGLSYVPSARTFGGSSYPDAGSKLERSTPGHVSIDGLETNEEHDSRILRPGISWREDDTEAELGAGSINPHQKVGGSASLSILSNVISRLSIVLARRSAVEETMESNPDREMPMNKRWSDSVSRTGFGFERNLLGRVANLLSIQDYLSSSRAGQPTTGGTTSDIYGEPFGDGKGYELPDQNSRRLHSAVATEAMNVNGLELTNSEVTRSEETPSEVMYAVQSSTSISSSSTTESAQSIATTKTTSTKDATTTAETKQTTESQYDSLVSSMDEMISAALQEGKELK